MNSIENNVCEAIEILAEKIINNADYDKTIQAQIVSCIDQEVGKYKIKYQNSYSYAYSTSPEIHYPNRTYVYVQVPNGDMKKNKTILNAIENSKVDYGVVIDLEDEYDKIGTNCISSGQYPFRLSSACLEKIIIYNRENSKDNKINIDINNFASNIIYADSFLCAATIRTNFKKTQIQGNYGIGFVFDFIDPEDENNTKQQIYELNVNNMQGNPYLYLNDTRQYQIFNIDGAKFKQISQIYIFIENFTTEQKQKTELTNDDYEVFISNLELQATNRMSEDEINGYALRVVAQDGNIFYNEDSTAQRHFISYLKYRGTVIDSSNIKFYWFRENSRVFSNNEKFNQYGGIGWECLNEKTKEKIPNWIAANEKFAITKSLVTAAELNFKCVAVYKDNQISKEFKLQNLSSSIPKIELSINRNDGTIEKDEVKFENGVGSPTIICTVTNTDLTSSDYSYRWTQEDANGTITNLIYDEEENFNAFVTIYDIQKYWEISDENTNYKNASRKEKALFDRMNSYLSQYEKCSLDFDNMKETASKTNIGKKFNETVQTLKSLGYRTFVSYNIDLYEEYIKIFNSLYDNIIKITKESSDYISSWKDTEGSIYNETTLGGILTNIEELSMESIKNDSTNKYYPEKHKYWNYIKEYYNNFNTTLENFIKTDKKIGDIQKCIDKLKENYDKLKIELSQRTLDYYGNKIYNFKVSEIYNFCIIKCAVTEINDDNDEYIGTSSIKIINIREQNVGTLMLKDGNQLFQYNESGISPADTSNINPVALTPLSFSLYTKTGELVSPNIIISNGSIEWKVPAENTLIEIEDTNYEEKIENNIVYHIYKNISSLAYKIKQVYSFSTYNQIELVVTYNNTIYSAKTNFTFLKQGEIGSSGTQYSCRIVPNTNMENIPQYPILTKVKGESIGYFNFTTEDNKLWGVGNNTTSSEGIRDEFPFNIEIYESNQKTYKSFMPGYADGNGDIYYDIQWEFLSNTYNNTKEVDISDFKIEINNDNKKPYLCLNINGEDDELYSFKNKGNYFGAANILKCTVIRIQGEEKNIFYATLPIVTVTIKKIINRVLTVNIKNGTGCQFVQYSSGGLNPQYNDLTPFELEVYNNNNNNMTEKLNYNWRTVGQLYDNENKKFINNFSFNILKVKDEQKNEIPYKIKAQAYQSYDGLNVTNGISCFITNKNQVYDKEEDIIKNSYAFINIPIHCYLNRYAFANLNAWDGNSIQIDDEGGYILTPQIGAGHKDKDEDTNTNTFTGLLMGDVKESSWKEKQTGLFAYNKGIRTIFLDAEDGTALFGAGAGQIAIAPGDKTWIYSKSFWQNDCFDEKGKLKNEVENSPKYTNNSGLLIDLGKPSIIYGNGNFKVDSDGYLTARNMTLLGGKINCGNGKFIVDEKGNLTANNATLNDANVTGAVNASSFKFKHFDEITSEIKSEGFYIKGQRGNNPSYQDMGFIGQSSKEKQDNVIGMTIGLKPDFKSYITLGVWDESKKVYISKIAWSSNNGLYDKQGIYFADKSYFSDNCYFSYNCYFSQPAGAYWRERFISSEPGHYYVELNDGRYLHFINGIFITVNQSEYI